MLKEKGKRHFSHRDAKSTKKNNNIGKKAEN